jgi:predicted porin
VNLVKIFTFILTMMANLVIAEVSMYGKVVVGLQNDSFPGAPTPRSNSVQGFGSYFGIRGYDPVYGQNSAIWQIEQLVDIASGQAYARVRSNSMVIPRGGESGNQRGRNTRVMNVLASGESYLGVQGEWGRLRLGMLSNYMRSSMGMLDMYNYGIGADGLVIYSRTNRIFPTTVRYDSPKWGGFGFVTMYSFQANGQSGIYPLNPDTSINGSLNGFYAGGIYSLGMSWVGGNFSAKAGTTIFENVGSYTTNLSSSFNPVGAKYPNAAYQYAYGNRIELGYNDQDGLIMGLGLQATSGYGWNSWVNSAGSWGNYITNPGYNYPGLNTNQYQTQELAVTLGWHLGPWTPKLSYVYGNDLMYNGDVLAVATGNAPKIPNSGYQQVVGEVNLNITPRTIVFVNYGQLLYGQTIANIAFCGNACNNVKSVNSSNHYQDSQATGAVGFSHTF